MNEFHVYKFTHLDSGKSYIGKSNNPLRRLCEHRSRVKCGSNDHFHNALRKYGEDAFSHEILWSGCDESEAYDREVELIAKYGTQLNGYNMTAGGDHGPSRLGYTHTEETKLKISQSNIGVSRGFGESKSESHRAAIGAAHAGKPKNYTNGRTLEWNISCPDGSTVVIENLHQFEKSLGLATNAIRNTIRTKKPHYSGYMVLGG